MRKRKTQPKLSRTTAHRNALLRNLSQELILHGQIKTTLAKAKALRPFVEPLITRAKSANNQAEQILSGILFNREVVKKLIESIGPRYNEEKRNGGYTRIIKLGPRQGDGSEEAIIQLVETTKVESAEAPKEKKGKKKDGKDN